MKSDCQFLDHRAVLYYKLTFCVKNNLTYSYSQDFISQKYFPSSLLTVPISCLTPWWKQTPQRLLHPVQWITQMNKDFSPSFTVSYVYFVPELQQSVSHLHRLSSVDGVNESVCASLYLGEQRPYAVTSEQAKRSDCWANAGFGSRRSFVSARIPNLRNNCSLSCWEAWNNVRRDEWLSHLFFIYNNTWNSTQLGELRRSSARALNDECHI